MEPTVISQRMTGNVVWNFPSSQNRWPRNLSKKVITMLFQTDTRIWRTKLRGMKSENFMTSGQQSMTRWVSNCAFPPKNSVQGYTRRRIQEAPNYPLAPLSLFYMALSSFQISVKMMLWLILAITVQTWGKLGKKLNFKAGIQRFVMIQVVFNFPPTASIFKRKAIFYF